MTLRKGPQGLGFTVAGVEESDENVSFLCRLQEQLLCLICDFCVVPMFFF